MKTKFLLFLTILSLFFCLACGKKQIVSVTPPAKMSSMGSSDLLRQADQAWTIKNTRKSQRLYSLLSRDESVSDDLKGLILKRLALSAIANRDMKEGEAALRAWAQKEPEARTTWDWNQAKAAIIQENQGDASAEQFMAAMLQNQQLPWNTQSQAARHLARIYLNRQESVQALHVYRAIHLQATSPAEKKELESYLQEDLRALPLETLAPAMDDPTLGSHMAFPNTLLIAIYDLKRIARDAHAWPQVWQDLNTLQDNGEWAEGFPFKEELTELTRKFGSPRHHVALLIPLQGPYKSMGWRIARGVGAAQWLLSQAGMDLEVTLINSAAPGWQQALADLPATCRIVGGPLQNTVWNKVLQNGLEKNRAFFTFMPSLANEGKTAWRFFGSPRDQVRTMISSALACNISTFAILYPEEPYGTKMAQYFWEEANRQGGEVTGMAAYTPRKPTLWGKAVAGLLNVRNLDKGELNPEPDFKAVFLPDSLDSAQLLAPQFFFYNENRLMFLGPQLWGQHGRNNNPLETHYFDLAVFPGAWWQDNPGPGVADLKKILNTNGQKEPDFWVALGFDFIRFTARLGGTGTRFTSTALNTSLAAPQAFDWSMAPITWDAEGRASQHYFTFQPTRQGPRVADPENIRGIIDARETHRQSQLDALKTAE